MNKIILSCFIFALFFSCRNDLLVPASNEELGDVDGVVIPNGAIRWDMSLKSGHKTVGIAMVKIDLPDANPYYIGSTEVTQSLWEAVLDGSCSRFTSRFGDGSDFPANSISYQDCEQFVLELNYRAHRGDIYNFPQGYSFAIPTGEEWRIAAAAGSNYEYAGSSTVDEVAVYSINSGGKLLEVAKKQPNAFGMYDVSGNVAEWCCDDLGDDTGYALGGHFNSVAGNCKISTLKTYDRNNRSAYLGLRLVLRKSDFPIIPVEKIEFSAPSFSTHSGYKLPIGVTVYPKKASSTKIIFTADSPDILELSHIPTSPYHVFTVGKNPGKTMLRANVEGTNIFAFCEVTVSDFYLSISKKVLSLTSVDTCQISLLTYSGRPVNSGEISWTVEDSSVASIFPSDSSNIYNVKALKCGKTKVVVSVKSDGVIFTYEKPIVVTTGITDLDIICDNYDGKTQSLRFDINSPPVQLKAKIIPENANNTQLVWSSGDETIVSVDKNGLLRSCGRVGETTVRVASKENPDVYAEYPVSVSVHLQDISLQLSSKPTLKTETCQTLDVNVSFIPENTTNKRLIWTVDDENVVKIEGSGSFVSIVAVGDESSCPNGYGKTTVRVTGEDGGFTREFDVEVIVEVRDLIIRDAKGNMLGDEGFVFHTGIEKTMPPASSFTVEPVPSHYHPSPMDGITITTSSTILRRTDSRNDKDKFDLALQPVARITPCSNGIYRSTMTVSYGNLTKVLPLNIFIDLIAVTIRTPEDDLLPYVEENARDYVPVRKTVIISPEPVYASIQDVTVSSTSEDGSSISGEAVFVGDGEAKCVSAISVYADRYADDTNAPKAYAYLNVAAKGISGNIVTVQSKYPFVIRQSPND